MEKSTLKTFGIMYLITHGMKLKCKIPVRKDYFHKKLNEEID